MVLLKTLAHEMVHVKQYALGTLDSFKGDPLWNSKLHKTTSYYDLPWELEANGYEAIMFFKFIKKYDRKLLKSQVIMKDML